MNRFVLSKRCNQEDVRLPNSLGSRGNIGDELHFQQGNVILELKFALFQAPQLKLIAKDIACQQVDNRVKIPVLYFQFDDSLFYLFGGDHGHIDECGN